MWLEVWVRGRRGGVGLDGFCLSVGVMLWVLVEGLLGVVRVCFSVLVPPVWAGMGMGCGFAGGPGMGPGPLLCLVVVWAGLRGHWWLLRVVVAMWRLG